MDHFDETRTFQVKEIFSLREEPTIEVVAKEAREAIIGNTLGGGTSLGTRWNFCICFLSSLTM